MAASTWIAQAVLDATAIFDFVQGVPEVWVPVTVVILLALMPRAVRAIKGAGK